MKTCWWSTPGRWNAGWNQSLLGSSVPKVIFVLTCSWSRGPGSYHSLLWPPTSCRWSTSPRRRWSERHKQATHLLHVSFWLTELSSVWGDLDKHAWLTVVELQIETWTLRQRRGFSSYLKLPWPLYSKTIQWLSSYTVHVDWKQNLVIWLKACQFVGLKDKKYFFFVFVLVAF